MDGELRAFVAQTAETLGLEVKLEQIWHSPVVAFDAKCVDAVRKGAERLGFDHMDMVSGAGHDACYINRVAPTGMIFVPCKDGISHNEIESAKPDELGAGCDVLLHAIIAAAKA